MQQEQHFSLEWIGVLKLIHEQVLIPPLKPIASIVVLHQVAGSQQEISEVQEASPTLRSLILLNYRPQFVPETNGKIRIRPFSIRRTTSANPRNRWIIAAFVGFDVSQKTKSCGVGFTD